MIGLFLDMLDLRKNKLGKFLVFESFTQCGKGASQIMSTLHTIERFLSRTGMAPTAFGRQAVRDPRFVHDLRNGREPTARTRRRVDHFISAHGRKGVQ